MSERVEWVHEGRTHRAHEPGEVVEPPPDRRFFASARVWFDMPGEPPFRFWRSFTCYGAIPEDALRRLWVLISRRLQGMA